VKYLDLAVRIAKANYVPASDRHYLFGCVAIRDDNAIVVSTNIRTREPTINAHAEGRIAKKCGHGAVLYLARIDRQGRWCNSKPCPGCTSLIRNRMVKRVYYTVSQDVYAVWNP
jgi:tRNA(Arg) A34 adenosine deaminase TadA